MNTTTKTILCLCAFAGLMTGCTKKSADDVEVSAKAATQSEDMSASNESAFKRAALSKYEALDDLQDLTPMYISKRPEPLPEDDIYAMLSAEYNSETDGFKKRDIAAKIKPEIDNLLNQFQSQKHYKIPMYPEDKFQWIEVGAGTTNPRVELYKKRNATEAAHEAQAAMMRDIEAATMGKSSPEPTKTRIEKASYEGLAQTVATHINPYDFDKEGFPFYVGQEESQPYDDTCLPNNLIIKNKQNVGVLVTTESPVAHDACLFKITDEALARKIESNKADYNIEGMLYMTIEGDYDKMIGHVDRMEWQLIEKPSKDTLNSWGNVIATQNFDF